MNIAAYCRVSTGSTEQLSSLENQKAFFEEYAQKLGHNLVKIYADRGISGKALKNRTEFLSMMSDASLGTFDMLVVKDISRFARNTVDFLTGIRTLKSRGIAVRFLSCHMDTLGESEFALTMFAAIAQEESYNLSKRIIFGKKVSAKNGRTPPYIYGYDKIDTFTLAINEAEALTVRLIFKAYTSGDLGIRKIASLLNSRAIPTKKGGLWTAKTVRRILSNPIYAGTLVNNKTQTLDFLSSTRRELPKNEHIHHQRDELAIVSTKCFQKAQQKLTERAKSCHKQK
ncbi:MAG: recombinase family protein [Clostridia bacterium]|nr:recombinase family protein [Clostridia bacterium]